jgi:hypothetical protein
MSKRFDPNSCVAIAVIDENTRIPPRSWDKTKIAPFSGEEACEKDSLDDPDCCRELKLVAFNFLPAERDITQRATPKHFGILVSWDR